MKRSIFVKNIALVTGSIILSKSLISCVSEKVDLIDLIGKSENLIDKSKKNGNNNFGYYQVSNYKYSHPDFIAEKVFIYCEDQKIVGYTIQINNTQNFENYKNKLSKINTIETKTYENDFGKGYQWKTSDRNITLEMTKANLNIPNYTFFSESILANRLIVF